MVSSQQVFIISGLLVVQSSWTFDNFSDPMAFADRWVSSWNDSDSDSDPDHRCPMLAAFFVLMAAATSQTGSDIPIVSSDARKLSQPSGGPGRGGRKWRGKRGRSAKGPGVSKSSLRTPKPSPTHFLSVRIDKPEIWHQVSAVQDDIVQRYGHLRDAVIPVEDLHVTLFVTTLREDDGSLERAKQTLEDCEDIIRQLGLSPGETATSCNDEALTVGKGEAAADDATVASTVSPMGEDTCSDGMKAANDAASELHGEDECDMTPLGNDLGRRDILVDSKWMRLDTAASNQVRDSQPPSPQDGTVPPQGESSAKIGGTPLKLSFQGLGTFGRRVLFARLVEDDEAARFRRLASALHERFVQARLVQAADDRPGKQTDGSRDAADGGADEVAGGEDDGAKAEDERKYLHCRDLGGELKEVTDSEFKGVVDNEVPDVADDPVVSSGDGHDGDGTQGAPDGDPMIGGGGSSDVVPVHDFDFEPHLTLMKTSKLKNRRAKIPGDAYEKLLDNDFGAYAPTAVELSSMQMREEEAKLPLGWEAGDAWPYYKCECKLPLCTDERGGVAQSAVASLSADAAVKHASG